MSRTSFFFFYPNPDPLIFSECWYWVPIRCLALTTVILYSCIEKKKYLHPFLNRFVNFVETKYILSYSSLSFCIVLAGESVSPRLVPPYHPLLFSYSLRCHVKWRGGVSFPFHACSTSHRLPVLHALLYETHKTSVHIVTQKWSQCNVMPRW